MTVIRRVALLCWVVLLAAVGCRPVATPQAQVLPTIAPMELPPTLENAMSVALNFLGSWQEGDYAAMYNLIAYTSREAIPQDAFTSAYQAASDTMTLQSLSYQGVALAPDPSRNDVAIFNYNISFETRLIGSFEDDNRNMQLVFDKQANDWRVAWDTGDIFAEMLNGAKLRLEISVPGRANIYDKDGNVLADQNGRVVIVRAVKQEITDWQACANLLAPAMNKEPSDLQKIYDVSSPDWSMELGTIEPAVYEQSHTMLESTCAASFDSRATRRYPNGTIAPNIVGSVGYPDESQLPDLEAEGFNSDSIIGQSGIEQNWDDRLRGHPGGRLIIVGASGTILREVARSASRPPESVWLTLDTKLQARTAQILADYYNRLKLGEQSKGAAAVVIDVHTGAILAMVSYPSFNADAFAPFPTMGRDAANTMVAELQSDPRRPLLNRATQGVYPLGSVMKTVSATAVLDSGVYSLDHKYTCIGIWKREDNFTRYDWYPPGHGTITTSGALTQSCNPFFYEVGYQMNTFDPASLPGYMKRAGFGLPTGLTDIAENAGFIPDPSWKETATGIPWSFSDAVNIAIGQGEVQVTPLQVVRWFGALANGGTLYRPQLVDKVGILGEAPSYEMAADPMLNINVRPEVLDTVRQGICAVTTSSSGTAEYQFRNSPLQTLGVCGKTGTAQDVPRPTHAWFAAYAPKEDPQVAIVVVVENGGEGSGVSAPIVRDILEYYFFGEK